MEDFYSSLGMTREELLDATEEALVDIESTIDVQPEVKVCSFPLTYRIVDGVLVFTGFLEWGTKPEEVPENVNVLYPSAGTAQLLLLSQLRVFG